MHCLARIAIASLILISQLAQAGAPPSPAIDDLTGHYYLTGRGEAGSELRLTNSGEFQWTLVYGAVDLFAHGTWKVEGERVILIPAQRKPGKFRGFEEDELNLRKGPAYGTWVAIVGIPNEGPISEVEVRFESRAGRSATAVSEPNGDAIVIMPSSEEWTRAGLRRAGSNDDWYWIDVPETRSRARIAGFAMTNLNEVRPSPFESLTLVLKGKELAVEDSDFGLQGVYQKPSALSQQDP